MRMLSVVVSFLLFSSVALGEVSVGDKAPGFTLKGKDGKEHSLKDYSGGVVVLEWYNSGCPFVRKHYDSGNMQDLQKTYTEKGVTWLRIVSSAPGKQGYMTVEEAKKNAKEENSHADMVLLDPEGKVGRSYGAKTTPHMYIIDKEGKLRYKGAIDSIPSTDQEDIPKAKDFVKMGLDRLLAGKSLKVTSTDAYGCSVKYSD